MEKLTLIQNDPNARKLAKIADFLGVGHEYVSDIPKHPSCIILNGSLFDEYHKDIEGLGHAVLVYDAGSSKIFSAKLKPIHHESTRIEISTLRGDVTSVLSGLSFQAAKTHKVFSNSHGYEPIILADEHSLFMARENLFLLANDGVLDIERVGEEGCEPHREYFTELIPFVMFMKRVLSEYCWRLSEYGACITIDDPLLRRRHGFIELPAFIEWLKTNRLAATFAFIPWNYEKSWQSITDLFKRNSDMLSICIHGCNHNKGEFAITDPEQLDSLARTAMARMTSHENKHALRHDRVMIFPQGMFTGDALVALQRNGYMAAVNTGLFPTNDSWSPSVRELLDSALLRPLSVPLYNRRYPVDLFDFACDIFFEKPILIVQHHRDFRAGFNTLRSFALGLNEIKPDMKWLPLGALLARSTWRKKESDGTFRTKSLISETQDAHGKPTDYNFIMRGSTAIRRCLSGFRDNHVDRSKVMIFLLKSMRTVRTFLTRHSW